MQCIRFEDATSTVPSVSGENGGATPAHDAHVTAHSAGVYAHSTVLETRANKVPFVCDRNHRQCVGGGLLCTLTGC
jgi:hypothetical protein